VLSQFTPEAGSRWGCLADFIATPGVYAAGRLDADSEGLLLLTDQGRLQQRLTDPAFGHWRRYWVQVEGNPNTTALDQLSSGVLIQGQRTRPSRVRILSAAELTAAAMPERDPPIRHRLRVPTCWLQLELREGRNRQVRRMTAAVGYPTLRLIRMAIDLMDGQPPLQLSGLAPGQWRPVSRGEEQRLHQLLGRGPAERSPAGQTSPGRGGRAGGGKSGRAGGGG
jgi:23S rRNA pseudouridine2457 synthase